MSLAQLNSLLTADRQTLEGLDFIAKNCPFLLADPPELVLEVVGKLLTLMGAETVPAPAQIVVDFKKISNAVDTMVPRVEVETVIPAQPSVEHKVDETETRARAVALVDPTDPRSEGLIVPGWETYQCVTCGKHFQHPPSAGPRKPSKCFDHIENYSAKQKRIHRISEALASLNQP